MYMSRNHYRYDLYPLIIAYGTFIQPLWENNADAHWHDCTAADCPVTNDSQKDGYGTHSWDAGTVTKEPTESETGAVIFFYRSLGKLNILITMAIPMIICSNLLVSIHKSI